MFGLDVAQKCRRLGEFGVAFLAGIGSISVVSSPVRDKIGTVGEDFAAVLTSVPFDTDVDRFDVAIEVGLLVEGLVVAESTNIAFYRFVGFAVIPQFLGRPECSLADVAGKVTFFGVSFPVCMKIT